MNFLLHHDFASRELGGGDWVELAAVGAMLPDLWRMADRRVRPTFVAFERESDPRLGAVLDGIDHHVSIDRWFHGSMSFTEGERDLRARFLETKSPKLLLFAHAAWEMCLDGALIRERGLGSLTAALGRALTSAEPHLGGASDLHHFDGATRSDADRERFDARMSRIVAAGREGALFEDYLTGTGIARRLAGMRLAFGFGPPRDSELDSWASALEPRVEAASSALVRLREERAAKRVAEAEEAK